MYKVKVTVANQENGMIRQIPQKVNGTVWENYQFFVNDDLEEADFWVVCSQKFSGKEAHCRVAPENILFFTWEPDSTYHYAKKFLDQFGKVVSCMKHLKHRNKVMDHPGIAWYVGKIINSDGSANFIRNYDDIVSARPKKEKLMSVICSNKCYTQGHIDRIRFVQKLKEHYGDQLDIFGSGFNQFEDKWDAIAPYKYHICLENCAQPYYWSEKLADTFLCSAYPFYYGCTNINQFFPNDAYSLIDVHNPAGAIQVIDKVIGENLALKNKKALEQAKYKVLNEENFFSLIIKHVQAMNPAAPKQDIRLYEDLCFWDCKKALIIGKRYLNRITFHLIQR